MISDYFKENPDSWLATFPAQSSQPAGSYLNQVEEEAMSLPPGGEVVEDEHFRLTSGSYKGV